MAHTVRPLQQKSACPAWVGWLRELRANPLGHVMREFKLQSGLPAGGCVRCGSWSSSRERQASY
eukprot:12925067-Prorocentrum_lima.AAC.1